MDVSRKRSMNKPIVAHSFEEMNKLDSELVNDIPLEKKKAAWKAITELFADPCYV